ncbi:MAG: methyltransferase domain-containing protein [Planctomycetota bacterium]
MITERIENEFGIPIPGEILDKERWASTALKKLPPTGPIDWTPIFERSAPLVVDLGCGNGRFLLASAIAHPDWNHVGVDFLPLVLRYATRRANHRGLANIRFAAVDGHQLVAKYLGDQSVREMHCYHPQPYYEREHMGRRLLAPRFFAELARVLEPGGSFIIQTDNGAYWKYIAQIAPQFCDFQERKEPWPDAPAGRTRREILARRRNLTIYRGVGIVKPMSYADAKALAETLPPPTFHAGRPPRGLDAEERE